jgi:RES domain-containing protein
MTTHRRLAEPMRAFRIGDPDGLFPIWDAGGALKRPGRWHAAGQAVIYASEHYSTAMLEKLVHHGGALPPNQHFLEITVPAGVSYEVVTPDTCPDWHAPDQAASRERGRAWFEKGEACMLVVPSVVARPERNLVVNALHPDFGRITTGLEAPVWWDARLFAP